MTTHRDSEAELLRVVVAPAAPVVVVHTVRRHHVDTCGREMWDESDDIIRTRMRVLDRITERAVDRVVGKDVTTHRDDAHEWYESGRPATVRWRAGCLPCATSRVAWLADPRSVRAEVDSRNHFTTDHGVTLIERSAA